MLPALPEGPSTGDPSRPHPPIPLTGAVLWPARARGGVGGGARVVVHPGMTHARAEAGGGGSESGPEDALTFETSSLAVSAGRAGTTFFFFLAMPARGLPTLHRRLRPFMAPRPSQ